jgi:hypothetical protein
LNHRLLIIGTALFLAACSAGPQVTTVQALSETADAPYDNVLVISLFKSFDARRYLEKDIVRQLENRGVRAVASTSLMDTKTPVTRETFLAMVESLDSDAVLVTQLVNLDSRGKMKDRRPELTYNFTPTYYYNVWGVEQADYIEPQSLQLTHNIVLATQLFSVRDLSPVWAIESKTKLVVAHDMRGDTSFITDEARAIVSHLTRDGLLAP